MEKDMNIEGIEEATDKANTLDGESTDEIAKAELPGDNSEGKATENTRDSVWKAYVPKFTEASERYRLKGDARIRERFGIKSITDDIYEEKSDEPSIDPTAELDSDVEGVEAKSPENVAKTDSDESLSIYKFSDDADDDAEAEKERNEIKKLLESLPSSSDTEESADEFFTEEGEEFFAESENPTDSGDLENSDETLSVDADEEEPEELDLTDDADSTEEDISESSEETEKGEDQADSHISKTSEHIDEIVMADPDLKDIGVYDFDISSSEEEIYEDKPEGASEAPVAVNSKKKSKIEREYTNPTDRDSIKDRFLDSLISIRIRLGASVLFALGLLLLEILTATKAISFKLFPGVSSYGTVAVVDFLMATCIFVLSLPEIIRAFRHLLSGRFIADFIILPMFVVLGGYTLTVLLTGATAYALFGLIFATVILPVITASLYRTKADFIAFKMVSAPEDKQIIDKKNTRELPTENMALDGAVDEYKSKTARTFRTSFISDFFKTVSQVELSDRHFAIVFGIPFGIALVAGIAAYFLSWSALTAVAVLSLSVMLGCPAFSIVAGKISYLHTQKAALLTDSVAVGENAFNEFSEVDVFAFEDTDVFGPDDVNLKRFMLYGERDGMDKVMRQMCALFAAVGGPLDYMFSGIIDNRVRHKSATNVIIEDDGVCGEVAGRTVCAGSEEYMLRNGIAIPAAALDAEKTTSFDTIKVMYAAEDGDISAKFYIRYSLSEEFTAILPSLRQDGIIPLVYTRDPNMSGELLQVLTAGSGEMRVVKLYKPLKEETVYSRVSASMVTYGDRLDAAGMVVLSKRYRRFGLYVKFAEICAMAIGSLLAIVLSIIGFSRVTVLIASIWQIVWCLALRYVSNVSFLKNARKREENDD